MKEREIKNIRNPIKEAICFFHQESMKKLKQDLKGFGLNPDHWKLRLITGSQALLENKMDESFRLLGKFERGKKTRWLEISLIQPANRN